MLAEFPCVPLNFFTSLVYWFGTWEGGWIDQMDSDKNDFFMPTHIHILETSGMTDR